MFNVNNKANGFIVNFEHISLLCSSVSIVNFEQVNAGWVTYINNAHIFESLPRNCENKFRKKF